MKKFVLSLFMVLSSLAANIAAEDTTAYEVFFDAIAIQPASANDTVPILIDAHGNEFAAFDLKVASSSAHFEITQIYWGEVCDSCGWEFFNTKKLEPIDSLGITSQWQIVGLADMMPDSVVPSCYGWDTVGSLAHVVVEMRRPPHSDDVIDSLFFLWEDCSDNTFSETGGVVLAISRQQGMPGMSDAVSDTTYFPNTTGAPESCISPTKADRVKRLVEFRTGHVRFVADSTSD